MAVDKGKKLGETLEQEKNAHTALKVGGGLLLSATVLGAGGATLQTVAPQAFRAIQARQIRSRPISCSQDSTWAISQGRSLTPLRQT